MVSVAIAISVDVRTFLSKNLKTIAILAISAQAIDILIPASRSALFFLDSIVWLFSVTIYQCSVRPGISRRMENGITIPEKMGSQR